MRGLSRRRACSWAFLGQPRVLRPLLTTPEDHKTRVDTTLQELFSSYANYLWEALHEVFDVKAAETIHPAPTLPRAFDEVRTEWLHKAEEYISATEVAVDRLGIASPWHATPTAAEPAGLVSSRPPLSGLPHQQPPWSQPP